MDPLTLFALANGAVSAIKAGCKLYKDIKSAAGDIKDVLKDLDEQFHSVYTAKGKTAPPEAVKQFNEEKKRIKELNQKDTGDVYFELGQHLGAFFDNQAKCIAVFEEEEKRSYDLYTGNSSIGNRALQRVLMKKKLEQMEVELREIMVYQSPPELGALYTDVEEMMAKMGKEQKVLLTKQIQRQQIEDRKRKVRMKKLRDDAMIGIAFLIIIFVFGFVMMLVAYDRQQKYPQFGNGLFPETEEKRRLNAEPKVYIGR